MHRRLEFLMPASADVVFDAFHYHHWKNQWDSLISDTQVAGGAPCPSVGAITGNPGKGFLAMLCMETRFMTFDPPRLAAATMVGTSFPFTRWAASMRHIDLSMEQSSLVYTYTFETGPRMLRWGMEPLVDWMFRRATRRRFAALARFLRLHERTIRQWQQSGTQSGYRNAGQ